MTAAWAAWWPLEISGAGLLGMLFCAVDIWRLNRRIRARGTGRTGEILAYRIGGHVYHPAAVEIIRSTPETD